MTLHNPNSEYSGRKQLLLSLLLKSPESGLTLTMILPVGCIEDDYVGSDHIIKNLVREQILGISDEKDADYWIVIKFHPNLRNSMVDWDFPGNSFRASIQRWTGLPRYQLLRENFKVQEYSVILKCETEPLPVLSPQQ